MASLGRVARSSGLTSHSQFVFVRECSGPTPSHCLPLQRGYMMMMMMGRASLVVYFHVPRTAGTSFRLYAERILDKKRILPLYGNLIPQARTVLGGVRNWGKWDLVRGHITTSCLDLIPAEAVLVTFLRNPVDRVASLYRYMVIDRGHPVHQMAKRMGLMEFVSSGVSLEVDNGMVRQLCGSEPELPQDPYNSARHPHTPIGGLGEDKLEETLELLEGFHVVGTVEHMGDTYNALCECTNWQRTAIPRANKTPASQLHGNVRRFIEERNKLDMRLWQWATARLVAERGYSWPQL